MKWMVWSGRIQLVDAPEMARIRELDSVLSNCKTNDIESDFDKAKTHVTLCLVFVPPEATVHLSVALQFRGDASRVLAIVLVGRAGWKMKKRNAMLRISKRFYWREIWREMRRRKVYQNCTENTSLQEFLIFFIIHRLRD